MPRKKKHGKPAAGASSKHAKHAKNAGAGPPAKGSKKVSKEETRTQELEHLQEMFKGRLDAVLVHMIMEDCNYDVEMALETLFKLAGDVPNHDGFNLNPHLEKPGELVSYSESETDETEELDDFSSVQYPPGNVGPSETAAGSSAGIKPPVVSSSNGVGLDDISLPHHKIKGLDFAITMVKQLDRNTFSEESVQKVTAGLMAYRDTGDRNKLKELGHLSAIAEMVLEVGIKEEEKEKASQPEVKFKPLHSRLPVYSATDDRLVGGMSSGSSGSLSSSPSHSDDETDHPDGSVPAVGGKSISESKEAGNPSVEPSNPEASALPQRTAQTKSSEKAPENLSLNNGEVERPLSGTNPNLSNTTINHATGSTTENRKEETATVRPKATVTFWNNLTTEQAETDEESDEDSEKDLDKDIIFHEDSESFREDNLSCELKGEESRSPSQCQSRESSCAPTPSLKRTSRRLSGGKSSGHPSAVCTSPTSTTPSDIPWKSGYDVIQPEADGEAAEMDPSEKFTDSGEGVYDNLGGKVLQMDAGEVRSHLIPGEELARKLQQEENLKKLTKMHIHKKPAKFVSPRSLKWNKKRQKEAEPGGAVTNGGQDGMRMEQILVGGGGLRDLLELGAVGGIGPGPGRYPPPVQKEVPKLAQIMAEEELRQEREKKEMWSSPSPVRANSIATKLKRDQLFEVFPDVDKKELDDIFQANNYDFQSTMREVIAVYREPAGPVKDVFSPEAVVEMEKRRESSPARTKKKGQSDGIDSQFQSSAQPDYDDYRAEATLHFNQRDECFKKAAKAYHLGQKERALHYTNQGHLHTVKMKEANRRAAEAMLVQRRHETDENKIDLRNLHVEEALQALQEVLCERHHQARCGIPSPGQQRYLEVVTGRGRLSKGGVAKLKPAVAKFLEQKGYRYTDANAGCLRVYF